jgi:hypothetical protein
MTCEWYQKLRQGFVSWEYDDLVLVYRQETFFVMCDVRSKYKEFSFPGNSLSLTLFMHFCGD